MENNLQTAPNRNDIIKLVADNYYSHNVLNNAHRGDIVEMIVLSALGDEWKLVGLGWHPWDLQLIRNNERFRIQVRQIAALQLWGKTKQLMLKFGWKKKPPEYFFRDHPGEEIENEGWFCELFIYGVHLETDEINVDQVDPMQWKFLVIPITELDYKQNSMTLEKALKRWQLISWYELFDSVENIICKQIIKKRGNCI